MTDLRWRMLAVLFAARTVLGFQFQTIASTEAPLRAGLGIGFAEIGTLIGIYMLPGIVLALPGGMLLRRFGDKATCLAGLALMAIGGVAAGLSTSYGPCLAGRIVSGTGGVFLSLSVTKMVTDWFAGREIVTAMSVMLTSWPLGIAAGLTIFVSLADAAGWAAVMHLAAGACLVALLAIGALYRPAAPVAPVGPMSVRAMVALPPRREAVPIVVAGLAWGALNLGLVAFFSFGPPLLAANGFARAEASSLTGLALWLTVIAMPLGGYWVQRRRQPDGPTMLFSALVAAALLAFALAPWAALVPIVAFGLFIGPPPGAIMAMPGRALSPENRAVGIGLFSMVYFICVAIGPIVAGALRDGFGPGAPILFGAGLFLAVVPLTWLFGVLLRDGAKPPRETPRPA